MKLNSVVLTGTTNGSGAATITSTNAHTGFLHSVQWIDGDLADGVDGVFSVTAASGAGGVAQTLLTLTDANIDLWYYPRMVVHDNTGTEVTYDATNQLYGPKAIINGILTLVIASGGDTKTGGAIVYYIPAE